MPLWLKALILGVVQGLTEFLPVSSSGHLALGYSLFKIPPESVLPFTVILHIGTLTAVVSYFWNELIELAKASLGIFWKSKRTEMTNLLIYVAISTILTAVIAFALKPYLTSFVLNPALVGTALIVNGIFLIVSSRFRGNRNSVNLKDSVVMGIFQGVAVIPGISRSGSTIFAGMMSGLDGRKAAEFSFILSVVAIAGAGVVEAKDIIGKTCIGVIPTLVGFTASAFSGYIAIRIVFESIKKGKFFIFGVYTIILGIIAVIFSI